MVYKVPERSGVIVPWSALKSSVTLHAVGEVPLAKAFAPASHTAAPVEYEYTEKRFPFVPAVLAAIVAPPV